MPAFWERAFPCGDEPPAVLCNRADIGVAGIPAVFVESNPGAEKMNRKRDRLEIIRDILNSIRDKGGKIKPTHILYKSNLSHQMLTLYLNELLSKGFMIEKRDKKGKKSYELIDKGYNYLKDYEVIRGFVDSYGLE